MFLHWIKRKSDIYEDETENTKVEYQEIFKKIIMVKSLKKLLNILKK